MREKQKENHTTTSVERLLRESAAWQPDTDAPNDLAFRALTRERRRGRIGTPIRVGGGSLVFAALLMLSVRVFVPGSGVSSPLPRTADLSPPPTEAEMFSVEVSLVAPRLVKAPVSPTLVAFHPAPHLPVQATVHRRQLLPLVRPLLNRQLVPTPTMGRPVPPDAISLDDAPPLVVPVVIAEATGNGGEITMTPAAMTMPAPSPTPAGTLVAEE